MCNDFTATSIKGQERLVLRSMISLLFNTAVLTAIVGIAISVMVVMTALQTVAAVFYGSHQVLV